MTSMLLDVSQCETISDADIVDSQETPPPEWVQGPLPPEPWKPKIAAKLGRGERVGLYTVAGLTIVAIGLFVAAATDQTPAKKPVAAAPSAKATAVVPVAPTGSAANPALAKGEQPSLTAVASAYSGTGDLAPATPSPSAAAVAPASVDSSAPSAASTKPAPVASAPTASKSGPANGNAARAAKGAKGKRVAASVAARSSQKGKRGKLAARTGKHPTKATRSAKAGKPQKRKVLAKKATGRSSSKKG